MSFRHLRAIVRKEINHIIRDRTTLILVLVTPTALLFLMAYALTVDIKHVPIAVLDHDQTPTSRAFVEQVTQGNDLDLYAQVDSLDQVNRLLVRGEVKAGLIIGAAFERDLLTLQGLNLQVVVDGTEPKTGGFAVQHIGGQAEAFVSELLAEQLQSGKTRFGTFDEQICPGPQGGLGQVNERIGQGTENARRPQSRIVAVQSVLYQAACLLVTKREKRFQGGGTQMRVAFLQLCPKVSLETVDPERHEHLD